MKQRLYTSDAWTWDDFTNPSQKELEEIFKEIGVPVELAEDCVDPKHLPKFQKLSEDSYFFITRHFDLKANRKAESVQTLTRKISILAGKSYLLTIHKSPQPIIGEVAADLISGEKMTSLLTALHLIKRSWSSYDFLLEMAENELERFELAVFSDESHSKVLKDVHILNRRLSVVKRLLLHSISVVQRMNFSGPDFSLLLTNLKETADHLIFFSDELVEDTTYLLNLHLSLASHRTSEVMRVLTLFSVFFMPLTFIVGIYGMNFENMPELKSPHGYYGVLAVMVMISAWIAFWFYRKGWFK